MTNSPYILLAYRPCCAVSVQIESTPHVWPARLYIA
jgi:hypothetical protein